MNKPREAFLCQECLETYYRLGNPSDEHHCEAFDCGNEEPLKWVGCEDSLEQTKRASKDLAR